MNNFKSILINSVIFILIFTNTIFSQPNLTTESITVKDGLSNNSVRDIVQDKYGYMWFATADGLNIYDGYKIKIVKAIPGDTTSLPSNELYRLFEDKQGIMWISTKAGLTKYNRDKNTFTTYRYSNNTSDIANWVIGIYEDSKGILWISSRDGLLQFDRKTEKFLRFDVMKTDNSVNEFIDYSDAAIESSEGGLYTGSQEFGILKFDYEASLFVQLPLKNNFQDKIYNTRYFMMDADKDNNLWLATSKGFFKIDLDTNTGYDMTPFEKKVVTSAFWDITVMGVHIDKTQNIWVGTARKGLYLLDTKKQSFEKFITPPSELFYEGFYTDNAGILWYGTTRGVRKYDFDRKPIQTFSLLTETDEKSDDGTESQKKIAVSFAGSNIYKDYIWLGSNRGLYLFNKSSETSIEAQKLNSRLSHFRENGIKSIMETKDGTLWLATTTEGLFSFEFNSGKFKNYQQKNYSSTSLIHNNVQSLVRDNDGNLWVGTHRGLNMLKKGSETFLTIPSFLNRKYNSVLLKKVKELQTGSQPVSSIINVGDYADLSKEFVLRKDSKLLIYSVGEGLPAWDMVDFGWLESNAGDTVWSGGELYETFHAGGGQKNRMTIGIIDLKSGRYKLRYKSDDSHSAQLYNDPPPQDSTYWGVQIFSLSEEEYIQYKEVLESSINKPYLKGRDIEALCYDSNNNIWAGTEQGISRIDTNFKITNYQAEETNNNAISNNFVRDIIDDAYGNIWIATQDGLNKFEPLKNKFTVFRERDGLPTTNISAIEKDNEGNLWVSSLKGLSKIELDESGDVQIIINYDVKDGLQGYEFLWRAAFKDTDGKLFFSGQDGFNTFYPGSSNRTKPYISLQNINVSNQDISDLEKDLPTDLEQINNLSLSHTQNDISFEFASIHFSRPDKNRLMYKMDGVDKEWQIGDRRYASYTNLDPGDYVFNIKGSNGDGVWSDDIKQINIHIAAAWYNNWIAYSVYVFVFFGLLFSIRRFEMARQKKNAKIKESQLRAEAAELKAKAAEAQALVVQAENERKTQELEEARALQLSMLPKELPQLPNLDIAVYMQTATEVGGDYYDFHVSMDGTLTVVIGDATGHGMKAGTMVTTAKTLFKSHAANPDILFSFQEFTRCIKEMNYGKLSMCMTMLKIKGDKMQISSAGMPPSFIFRRDTRVVEEHLFKAMPLGTMEKFPYKIKDTKLEAGDTILLMSDGLPELENDSGEMYGYKKIRNGFEDVAEKAPEEIISFLKNEGKSWSNDHPPDDDVTFVVIKVK